MRSSASVLTAITGLLLLLHLCGCGTRAGAELAECPVAQCPMAKCTCVGGGVAMAYRCRTGPCLSAQASCAGSCSEGLERALAVPDRSAKGSPECAAYCSKMKAMTTTCGGRPETCNERESCWDDRADCSESLRASIKCVVDTGSWTCATGGGVSIGAACPPDNSVCAAADAATGG